MILDFLRQEEGMTLSEVTKKFSLNKSTTFRLLYTLELMGYVKKVGNLYSTTNKTEEKTNPFHSRSNWLSIPPLYQLNSEIGETMNVGILHGTNIVITQVVDGTHSTRIHSEVGASSPAHLSALGKVIMAFLNEQERENLIKKLNLIQKTEHTFVDFHLLKEHLKVIRSQGYAIDDEEAESGLRCIAAPIMYKGEVIAAIAVLGPSIRLIKKQDRNLSKKLIQCSNQISNMLD
ncbi:hypothetical protein BK708_14165 [Bacillus thuringiensis serovar yunnanensis]|nr:hypothetical protein BK708_14165 [Bacillus thuringiensis serovar yunnanensis]